MMADERPLGEATLVYEPGRFADAQSKVNRGRGLFWPILWLAAGVLLALGFGLLFDRLWWAAWTLVAAYLAWGVLLFFGALLRFLRRDRRGIEGLVLFLVGGIVLAIASPQLKRAGDWLWFVTHRATYDAVVADLRAGREPPAAMNVHTDAGPPLRVAFVWGGVGDRWRGVVWDPTRIFASAEPGGAPVAAEARRLFHGGLESCRPLPGDYFLCRFA